VLVAIIIKRQAEINQIIFQICFVLQNSSARFLASSKSSPGIPDVC